MPAHLPAGAVILVAPTSRGRPTTRVRVDEWEERRGIYIGVELGLSSTERASGDIPAVRAVPPRRILAVRRRDGFQAVLPGMMG